MSTLNDLPVELLSQIFKHLPLTDLDNCRLVCRQFMLICDAIPITDLIFWNISSSYGSRKDYWQFTNEQFSYSNLIDFHYEKKTGHRWTFRLAKLKQLYYHGGVENPCFWNRLNDLHQLVHLRLEMNEFYFNALRIIQLNLPNLERLEIGEGYSEQCELHLNTPKLSMLTCSEFEAIRIADPTTIEHLELVRYTETADQLVNLKYLKVNWKTIRHRKIWSIFGELQTLVCNSFDDDGPDDFDASMEAIRNLLLIKKPHQKIYFQSVELVYRSTINEYEASKNILAFQISNYGSLCANISHHGPLDYNELMRLTNGNLPVDFFQKYFNVRSVKVVGEVNKPEHLLWFLKRFEYLNRLEIDSSSVSQEVYNQLHSIGQLTRIIVKNNASITNHDVLLKLRLLKEFSTDQNGAHFLDLALALFTRHDFFAKISFNVRSEHIWMQKVWHCRMYQFTRLLPGQKGTENGGFELLKCPRSLMGLDDLEHVLKKYKVYLSTGNFTYRKDLT
ncbi:uncharacterized protein LOC119086038 [Bradysia coprophila]|uniref:uncharacterized protein LOC119086038 n=1 Tax=Bradysia coprophila TaxID=38358 RepID=UPI00187DAB18|nr:uncharacterized protein LOC119086038 [Bradysia coprophila]